MKQCPLFLSLWMILVKNVKKLKILIMKNIKYLFLLLIVSFFSGCSDQKVKIGDENFEKALINNKLDDKLDGILIIDENITSKTDTLNISGSNIKSIEGIEYFISLKKLDCSNNDISSINVSKNTNLEELNCSNNNINSIDLNKNLQLKRLYVHNNQKGRPNYPPTHPKFREFRNKKSDNFQLNISNNINLEELNCSSNLISSLDVSKNIDLVELNCSNNKLSSINLSNNSKLERLYCSSNYNYINLKLRPEYKTGGPKYVPEYIPLKLDVSSNINLKELYCSLCFLTSLDVSKNSNLENLVCSQNQMILLDVSNNHKLKRLRSEENNLSTLDVSHNPLLEKLFCYRNQLTSLDVSYNSYLKNLYCSDNQLITLDFSPTSELETIACNNNRLTDIDISRISNLKELYCSSNELKFLDVFQNYNLETLKCDNNVPYYPELHEFVAINRNKVKPIESSNDFEDIKTCLYWLIGLLLFLIISKIIKNLK
jgi:Leucine-rich repeat (LRR) protein